MDTAKQDTGNQLPARAPSAVTVHCDSLTPDAGEEGRNALARIVRQVHESSCCARSTIWRRVLFIWFRIYKYESRSIEKSSVLDLRIPIPVPLVGALFRQGLSWSQAFRFIEQSRRPQGVPPERFLESCMPLEFLRLYEGKNGKEELLVIGFD